VKAGRDADSWGRYPPARAQRMIRADWRFENLPQTGPPGATLLPRGNGRSYGDSCLNEGGLLLHTGAIDRMIAFDPESGRLRCEAGVLLADIVDLAMRRGWYPPVTPGTLLVTVGGAVANDVHGKNHHRAGSFCDHVTGLELLRSDGSRIVCGPDREADWFAATAGGLGLTGLITWVELQLRPLAGPLLEVETVPFEDLDGFLELSRRYSETREYTVAWFDSLAADRARGLFQHAEPLAEAAEPPRRRQTVTVPDLLPFSLVRPFSVRAFNALYHGLGRRRGRQRTDCLSFLYPLDGLNRWNRLYGPRGFLQYQCVVPDDGDGVAVLRALLAEIAQSRRGSALTVLKVFGERRSRGILGFPRPGITVALDFPNRGWPTLELLERLDGLTRSVGGAVYPAKDARMSPQTFQSGFPRWREMHAYIDPRFSSSFWRRVTGEST